MKTLLDPVDREAVLHRLSRLRPDTERRWGKMTPHQMICHLSDSFRVCLGDKSVSFMKGIPMRGLVRWAALYSPLPWMKGAPTRPEVKQDCGGTPPVEFELDRTDLLRLTERFVQSAGALRSAKHPMFGAMPLRDWMRWGYLHMDHHLRQFGL